MADAGLGDNRVVAVGDDDAEGAVDGLLGLFPGEGRVGIADAHRQAEAQGVREADPLGGVAAVHEVVVLEELGAGGGHLLEHFDGLVEFVEELDIDLVERVVEVGEVAGVGVGDRAVVVGHLVHRGHFQDLGERQFVLHPVFEGGGFKVRVTAHRILVLDGEHPAVPAVVHVPAGVVAVAQGRGHVAAPCLGAQVVHDLVVGVQPGSVAVDDDGTFELLEHAAEGETVLGHLLVAHAVDVLGQLFKVLGAPGKDGQRCDRRKHIFGNVLFHRAHAYLTMHTATRLDSGLREASRSPATEFSVIRLRAMPAFTSMSTTLAARCWESSSLISSVPVPLSA